MTCVFLHAMATLAWSSIEIGSILLVPTIHHPRVPFDFLKSFCLMRTGGLLSDDAFSIVMISWRLEVCCNQASIGEMDIFWIGIFLKKAHERSYHSMLKRAPSQSRMGSTYLVEPVERNVFDGGKQRCNPNDKRYELASAFDDIRSLNPIQRDRLLNEHNEAQNGGAYQDVRKSTIYNRSLPIWSVSEFLFEGLLPLLFSGVKCSGLAQFR